MHCLVLFLAFLLTNVRAQFNVCQCTCCRSSAPGQQCIPTSLSSINLNAQTCSLETCLPLCRTAYVECQGTTAADQIIPVCLLSNHTTTTNATTTTPPKPSWLGNTCKCTSYQLNACGSPIFLGMTSAFSCSCDACTQACRNQYPLSPIIQTAGTCISENTAVRFCNCQCSDTRGSIDYKVSTNETCTACNELCRQYQPCDRIAQVLVLSCSNAPKQALFPSINMILIISLSIFSLGY